MEPEDRTPDPLAEMDAGLRRWADCLPPAQRRWLAFALTGAAAVGVNWVADGGGELVTGKGDKMVP